MFSCFSAESVAQSIELHSLVPVFGQGTPQQQETLAPQPESSQVWRSSPQQDHLPRVFCASVSLSVSHSQAQECPKQAGHFLLQSRPQSSLFADPNREEPSLLPRKRKYWSLPQRDSLHHRCAMQRGSHRGWRPQQMRPHSQSPGVLRPCLRE